MVASALRQFQPLPDAAAIVGDIHADMEASVRSILLSTNETCTSKIAAEPEAARDLAAAATMLLTQQKVGYVE